MTVGAMGRVASSAEAPNLVAAVRRRLARPVRSFERVLRTRDLGLLSMSAALDWSAEQTYLVAVAVYAYRAGGVAAVGLVGLIRMLPAAVSALFGSVVADRYRRERVVTVLHGMRALVAAASALAVFRGAPLGVVYALAAAAFIASSILRPTQWALMPLLARTPEQLCATNVTYTTFESAAALIGPLLGGVVVAVAGAGEAFSGVAVLFALSTLLSARIARTLRPRREEGRRVLREVREGVRAVAGAPKPRLIVALFGAQTLVRGSLNVLIVVAAIELLGLGNAGVGYLTAALGAGGIVGGMVAMTLVARRRLALPFAGGLVLWGAPIALVAAWPTRVSALLLLVVPGVGNAILDVSGYTILQRITPDRMLGRALGVLEMVVMAGVGIGSIVGAALVEAFGIRAAMVATGALLPVLALLARRKLRVIDDESVVPEHELDVLRHVALFQGLPPITLEHLASNVVPVQVPEGVHVFRKGQMGDRFYVVRSGHARVAANRKTAAILGPGEYFGEIALLRDVPRTATVTAKEPLELYALQREEFLAAITYYHESAALADETVESRLTTL